MVDAILDNSLLQEYCIKILNKDSFQFLSLTRLAGVTLAAIIHRPEKLVKSCGFIFQFLSYIDEQPIFDFFKALFKNKSRFAKIQKWLVLSKFETIITEQIAMVSVDDLRLAYLFRLVAISEKSPILFPHFAQKKVMSKISQKITKLYEDDRLEALLAIYCKETIDVMRCFFQQVIDILKDAYIECTRCRVAALKMITKMLKYDPQLHFYIADAQLASTMNRLIVQFSCHTFLFMAIGDFAEAAFTSMVVSSRLVPDFIPMCVDMVRSETIKSIVALCCRILNSASEEAERSESFYGLLNEIPRFKTCVNGLLKNYNIIQSSKYG